MSATPADSEGLGRWVLLPWVAVAAIFGAAVLFLPRVECDGFDPGMTAGRVAFVACSAGMVAVLLLGAAYRIVRLHQAGLFRWPLDWTLVAVAATFAVLVAISSLAGIGRVHDVRELFLIGFLVATACWLASFVVFATARRSDDAGALVPVMLILVAAFVCYPFAAIILGLNKGALC